RFSRPLPASSRVSRRSSKLFIPTRPAHLQCPSPCADRRANVTSPACLSYSVPGLMLNGRSRCQKLLVGADRKRLALLIASFKRELPILGFNAWTLACRTEILCPATLGSRLEAAGPCSTGNAVS